MQNSVSETANTLTLTDFERNIVSFLNKKYEESRWPFLQRHLSIIKSDAFKKKRLPKKVFILFF